MFSPSLSYALCVNSLGEHNDNKEIQLHFQCKRNSRKDLYIYTNLSINIPEADLTSGVDAPQHLKDIASDIIRELFHDGDLSFDACSLIQTDTGIDLVEFVKTPKEVKED